MEHFLQLVLESLKTTGLLIWYTLWAFILGYMLSAAIQTLVTREQMSNVLGEKGIRQMGLAGFFGFISSSCSFASLAATRSVMVKGAHPKNAIAFLIATTNLVIETGIVLWLLVGWKFVVANFALGVIMIMYGFIISEKVADRGKEHAKSLKPRNLNIRHQKAKNGIRSSSQNRE